MLVENSKQNPWISLAVGTLFLFYQFINLNIFAPLVPQITHYFHLSTLKVGILSSSYLLGNFLMLIPAGILMDKLPVKKLLIINFLITSILTMIFALSSHFMLSALCRFLIGASGAFCFTGAIRVAIQFVPKKQMALATGVIYMIGMLGGIAAQLLSSALPGSIKWQYLFVIISVLGLFFLLLVWLILPNKTILMDPSEGYVNTPFSTIRKIISNQNNWLCAFYVSTLNLPLFVIGALWGNLYLRHAKQLDISQASTIITMIFIGAIIGSPLAGKISDSLRMRKPIMLVIAISAFVIFLIIMLKPMTNFWALLFLFLFLGFTTGAQALGYTSAIEQNSPSVSASVTSFISLIAIGFSMLFQPIFGQLLQIGQSTISYNFTPAMISILLMLALAVFSAFFLKKNTI